MNCTHVEKLLALHVENDLNGEQASAVTAHLAACSGCRALAGEYRASQSLLRLHTPPEFDGAFFDAVRRAVREEIDRDAAPSVFARFADFARLANFARLAGQTSPRQMAFAASLAVFALVFGATALRSWHDRSEVVPGLQLAASGDAMAGGELKFEREVEKRDEIEFGSGAISKSSSAASRRHNATAQVALMMRRSSKSPALHVREVQPNPPDKFITAPDFENASGGAQSVAEVQNMSATEIARSSTDAAPGVLRIELQTGDPNIRIIWLTPTAANSASTKQKTDIR